MSKNIKRRSSISALALGAAISIGVAAVPVASAAPVSAEDNARSNQTVAAQDKNTSVLAATNVDGFINKLRGFFSNKDAKQIAGDIDSFRAEIDKALNNKELAGKLNLQGDQVESLNKFLKDLEANKDSLSGLAIAIRDIEDARNKVEESENGNTENAEPTEPTDKAEPKPEAAPDKDKPETGSETKPDKTSKPGIVELTMTTKDGKITTTTLEDLPAEALAQLREALKAVDNGNGGAGENTGENADKNTGKDSDKKTESDKTTDSATLNEELRRLIALYEAGQTGNSEITKELLKRLQSENKAGDNNTVIGKNVTTVQNIEGGGSTSVAINVTPDGGLSITAVTGVNAEGKTKTGAEATKDTATIIDALNKLIEALGGKAPGTGNTGETKPGETTPDKPQTEEEAQRDRLVRAILALTSPEREANSPENAERNALISIAKALKEGKKVDLNQLTTEQLITVMGWLQNGIPEPETTPSEKATETETLKPKETTEPKATETETSKPKETETKESETEKSTEKTTEKSTEKTTESSTSKKSESESSKSSESSSTATTSAKSKEEQIRDLNKAVQNEINALDSQKAASNGSESGYTRPTNRVQVGNKTGSGGSGSKSSGSGSSSGSKSSGSSTGTASSTATSAANVTTEPTSEDLAVTGNSTQIMLAILALLGLIGAGAVTVALRRTRDAE